MTVSRKATRWIIELDYNADPDMEVSAVQTELVDLLDASKGNPIIKGSTILLDEIDDAMAVKFRFNENIVSIARAV